MLWLVPFVSPDSPALRELEPAGLLVRDATGATAVRRWWNGLSALLDLSNPAAISWLTAQLDDLIARDGVDGFKFDGGDIRDFHAGDITRQPLHPTGMCEAWATVGLRYPFNEYRGSRIDPPVRTGIRRNRSLMLGKLLDAWQIWQASSSLPSFLATRPDRRTGEPGFRL